MTIEKERRKRKGNDGEDEDYFIFHYRFKWPKCGHEIRATTPWFDEDACRTQEVWLKANGICGDCPDERGFIPNAAPPRLRRGE